MSLYFYWTVKGHLVYNKKVFDFYYEAKIVQKCQRKSKSSFKDRFESMLNSETEEKRRKKMPKTKFQSVIFTAITAWIMVYIMTLYNTVLATGNFTNSTFFVALKGMWIEYIIIFLCAFFISSHIAKYFAFRVVRPGDRPIAIIFAIQVFTVVSQVALASILGVYHGYGFNSQLIPNYLVTYCRNFIMALPVQLFIAGPVARWIFRSIFERGNHTANV